MIGFSVDPTIILFLLMILFHVSIEKTGLKTFAYPAKEGVEGEKNNRGQGKNRVYLRGTAPRRAEYAWRRE